MSSASPAEASPEPPVRRSSRANALVIGLGGTMLLAAAGVLTYTLTTRSRDAVVDADFIELASPISGQLTELLVDAGEAVRTGQPLARVQDPRATDEDVQDLRTALTTAQAQLAQVERELSLKKQLEIEFVRDANDQQRLQSSNSLHSLEELKAELTAAQQELRFSQRDLMRQEDLFRKGAIAETVVDRARTNMTRNREQVQALNARIKAQDDRLQAASRNLTLDRTRGGSDPLPRLQTTRIELARLEGERAADIKRVNGLQSQLSALETNYRQRSNVVLSAPINAVIWRLQARNGDTVRIDQPLLRLLNCRSRWVSTYVSERDLKRLRIGSSATVDLIGADLDLRGQVDLIRSGVGRLSRTDDDPGPLPLNHARQSQVRVRIDSDMPAPPRKFCFVGYSARVAFR